MNSNNIITLDEAIATTIARESSGVSSPGEKLDASIGLAAIELAEFSWIGRKCPLEEFLRNPDSQVKTLGVIGMNPIGQEIVQQARLGFGLEILYSDCQPVPEIEHAYDARFVAADDVLHEADLVCIVLPLAGKLVRLITQHYMALKSTQTIGIAWRRSLPTERAAIHLGKNYTDCVRLDELASIANLSKFRLARLFSATLGITPHRFQLLLRIFYARSLLHQGVEIGEISYRLGFSDQSHFGRCFRSIAGIAPGQYQKAVLHENFGVGLFSELAFEAEVANS